MRHAGGAIHRLASPEAEEAGEVDRWHNPTDAAGARAEEEEEEPVVAGPPRNYPL